MAKPVEEWSVDELRAEAARLLDELARRAATPSPGRKGGTDVVRACENWVLGRAWDETFTTEMVRDEFSVLERKAGHELPAAEWQRLLQLWLALRAERFPRAA